MDAFRFDGKLTCLPQNISSLVVYYNKDMFEEAGVAEPKAGWKWDDMVAAAKKLTKDRTATARPRSTASESKRRSSASRRSSGRTAAKSSTTMSSRHTSRWTRPRPRRRSSGLLPAAPRREGRARATKRSRPRTTRPASRTAEWRWCMSSRRATPTFRTDQGLRLGHRAASRSTREQAGILHSDAYCMTKASENKEAAWSFMEYALGPEGRQIVAKSGRTVPSLKSVAESEAFLDPTAKPANSQVFLDTIPVIRQVPSISTWPEIEDAAKPILEEGFYKGEGVPAVVGELRAATDPIFERAEKRVSADSADGRTEVRGRPEGLRFDPGAPRPRSRRGRRGADRPRWPLRLGQEHRPASSLPASRTSPRARFTSAVVTSRVSARAERNISMVFQSYALFPHLTVGREHRLRLAGPRRRARQRSRAGSNRPRRSSAAASSWSAGRSSSRAGNVSESPWPARSCASPTSSSSTSRSRTSTPSCACTMRAELKRLHQRLEATMIYVTHDQVEALTLGDRVAVLRDGELQQLGPPDEVYRRPANRFVAQFIGSPAMNFFPGRLEDGGLRAGPFLFAPIPAKGLPPGARGSRSGSGRSTSASHASRGTRARGASPRGRWKRDLRPPGRGREDAGRASCRSQRRPETGETVRAERRRRTPLPVRRARLARA